MKLSLTDTVFQNVQISPRGYGFIISDVAALGKFFTCFCLVFFQLSIVEVKNMIIWEYSEMDFN